MTHRPDHSLISGGKYTDLSSRGLREETLKKFRYRVGEYKGAPCHIAPYFNNDGEVVAQKVRLPGTEFRFLAEPRAVQQLFGQQVWGSGGRKVVVTEGEIDAMSVAQAQDLKWPVVSVANGAGDTKGIAKSLQWLETFDEVIIMFDADEAGRAGAIEAAKQLSPG